MSKKGSEILLNLLKAKGVDICFGYPGGAILPFYDTLYNSDIKHILVRHEQGAIHMAEGYARVSGKPGIVVVTSGPGATNIVTGLANAKLDSVPIFAITGQVATKDIGTDAFQEADIFGITIPITKYNALVKNVDELALTFEEAWLMATTGRPGPVLIDFPKDIQNAESTVTNSKQNLSRRLYETQPSMGDIDKFVEAINNSKKPLLLVGGGAIISGSQEEIVKLAELLSSPVASTLMGLGAFPASNKLSLGMVGMHGTPGSNRAVHECDYILSLGCRFADRVAGKADDFAPNAVKAHIDIDPAEFNKRISVDHILCGDLTQVIQKILPEIKKQDRSEWTSHILDYHKKNPLSYETSKTDIKPQKILSRLYELTEGKAIVATDVGQHQMWTAQYYHFDKPQRWLTSGGLGCMGYGLPAAIGAQLARPDDLVVLVTGDGSFQMCIQELATIKQYNLPIKILLLNNNFLGMVRQWQELFFGERYAESEWQFNPDFVGLAESYGIPGLKITRPDEIDSGLERFLKEKSSFLLEVKIPPEEKVFPMIPAGKSQRDIVEFKDLDKLRAK